MRERARGPWAKRKEDMSVGSLGGGMETFCGFGGVEVVPMMAHLLL